MIKIAGKLITEKDEKQIEYMAFETDGKIVRVIREDESVGSKEWFDLRPIDDDLDSFLDSGISGDLEKKVQLPNRHGYGVVSAYGILETEFCNFLVTDAFGGLSFYDFLNNSATDSAGDINSKDIISFIKDITSSMVVWKNFHGYIGWQTIVINPQHNPCRGGLICFSEAFPFSDSLVEFLRPNIYLKKLGVSKNIADDNHAVVLALLQFISLNIGISEPMASSQLLDEFNTIIKEKELSRFYNSKIYPYAKKFINGAVAIDELEIFYNKAYEDLEEGERIGQYLKKEIWKSDPPQAKLTRSDIFSGFYCPFCGTLVPALESSDGREACPICHRILCFPRTPDRKICRTCKRDFNIQKDSCLYCGLDKGSDDTISTETFDDDPFLSSDECNLDDLTPLKILPGFEKKTQAAQEKKDSKKISQTLQQVGKTQARPKIDRKTMEEIAVEGGIDDLNDLDLEALESETPSNFQVECSHRGDELHIDIKGARPGKWKFIVSIDEEGKNIIEEREYIGADMSLNYVIPLESKDAYDKIFVYVWVYQDNSQLYNQKVLLDNKGKGFLGKIWKK